MILKNIRDKYYFTHVARQVYPEDSAGLYKAYLDATKKPHGYFLLDYSQDTVNQLRFPTNIFPDEIPPPIYTA